MNRMPLVLCKMLVFGSLLLWLTVSPLQAAAPEKRVALVIGNSAYQNTQALANPRNDAIDVGEALKRLGFEVDVVVDAKKTEMDTALRNFGNNLDGAEAAVFFFAGHGLQVDGTNHILPVDAALKNERDLGWEAIDMTTVLKQMESGKRVNLLFLDACRDNPLSQTLARGMGESRSAAIGRGLAPMKAATGTLISYSTKEGEVAADGKGRHSPYTDALLKQIEQPGVEVGLMLRKVRQDVIGTTKNRQVPWEYGSLLGEFYFTGSPAAPAQPVVDKPVEQPRLEALYWQSIMNDTSPEVFDAYLKKYPNGEFSELARIKIDSMKNGSSRTGDTSGSSAPGDSQKPAAPTPVPETSPPSTPPTPAHAPQDDRKASGPTQTAQSTAVDVSVKKGPRLMKLDDSGKPLPDSAPSWSVVVDNETGLVWEAKRGKDGTRNYDKADDADNTYTWYDGEKKIIASLNETRLGGFSDWRLPTLNELKSLVVLHRTKPELFNTFFSDIQNAFYWSSTVADNSALGAWGIHFGRNGYDYYEGKFGSYYVRGVCGKQ